MKPRAVIYVRTSSEHQGEKSSPTEQETDCRKLAADQGLKIVGVYRDIEKYRVRNKLVEPSGTRSDRPGLLAMLRDASKGEFDIILAWREDRLYRGMRSMLLVLETIQERKIQIMLARETFDPKIAPLRAWVAQMELDGMKERMTMGVKARLKSGKANTGQDRYGYKRIGGVIEVVEEEAYWVRQIFSWYIDGLPILEIRKRLIAANAPQKGSSIPRRIQWARSSIQAVLISAKEYAYGMKIQTRKGEAFQIPVEPIIDTVTYERYLSVRESKKTHPIRSIKYDYLIGGKLYCDCNFKWGARTNKSKRNRKGELIRRKTPVQVYYCGQTHKEHVSPNCPRHIGAKKAEEIVWQKVCDAINKPEYLLGQARQIVDQIRASQGTLEQDRLKIENQLEAVMTERQWVITQARKGIFTTNDMEYQLSQLTFHEITLKQELATLGETININALNNWEENVAEFLADLKAGVEELKIVAPQTPEEQHEIFVLKKRIIDTLVELVEIDRDRNLFVQIRLNLLDILRKDAESGDPTAGVQNFEGEIYTHTQSTLVHLRHCASCG
ncbi:MAG: recombinase family protein [Chloroflexi bacterium]|nr:recombinase family protein [Chloroflexota bacterium]